MTAADLDIHGILARHREWLDGKPGGERANLVRANLAGANLAGAILDGANLAGANLAGAILVRANLVRANLVGANLVRANLAGANLAGAILVRANLGWANLGGANLRGAIGNMREVVSAQVETWPITAARMLDGSVVMQIGCQRHPLEMWRKADPRWIAAMDPRATEWWAKWGAIALAIGAEAEAKQEADAA